MSALRGAGTNTPSPVLTAMPMTPADRKLKLFHGERDGSVDPVVQEFAC